MLAYIDLNLGTNLPLLMFFQFSIRGISYAVNNPAKEVLWLSTTKEEKLKAKGWVDSIGSRTMKMGGSSINYFFKEATYGYKIAIGVSLLWIASAIYTGKQNEKTIRHTEQEG